METKMKEVTNGLMAYFESWKSLSVKANLSEAIALEAVKQNEDALKYVKEQTFEKIAWRKK